MVRILQVSDSHLSTRAPFADDNWQAVVDYVHTHRPDFVVHTGDISLNGADDDTDLLHARAQLERLGVPWRAIPGNHDIGDFGDTLQPVTEARRHRYADVFGAPSWTVDFGGITLVGLDVQTLLSGLASSLDLWDWLDEQLGAAGPVALFLHRPLLPWHPAETDDPRRYVTEPSRSRLGAILHRADLRLVASGHVHQWRMVEHERTKHIWAPSTWAMLPEHIQPTIGTKAVGFVEHVLSSDADNAVVSTLVRPAGIAQVTIEADFASPYAH